jgi:hypothetical protein
VCSVSYEQKPLSGVLCGKPERQKNRWKAEMAISPEQSSPMAFLSWAAYDYSNDIILNPGSSVPIVEHIQITARLNLAGSGWTPLGWADLDPIGIDDPLPVGTFNSDGFYLTARPRP